MVQDHERKRKRIESFVKYYMRREEYRDRVERKGYKVEGDHHEMGLVPRVYYRD